MELENVEDVYPLSPTQAGMLFHTASAPHSGVYVGRVRCLLSGDLDLETFQATWQEVLQRHPALRTAFLWDGLEEPLQVVRQHVDLSWRVFDWSETGEQERANRLEELMLADRRAGFDLGDAPLMRMLLIRVDDGRHQFVWSCHHLLVDGWSATIVLDEVFQLYEARMARRDFSLPVAVPYRDYITWLRSLEQEEAAAFWRDYLGGFVTRTSLRTPRVSLPSGQRPLHRLLEVRLSRVRSAALMETARKLRITPSTVLHGAWSLLLQRYSDENDLVFGTTTAGRPASLPGVDQSVGLFINTLPVRVMVDDAQVLGRWLASLQQNLLQVRQYEHSPLVRIQDWSDMAAGEALFDTLLVLENYPLRQNSRDESARLKLLECESLDQSNYPLAALVIPADELQLMLVYDPSIYPEETVKGILDHFKTLLSVIPTHLDRPLRELSMLSDDLEHRLLVTWNNTVEVLPQAGSVLDFISKQTSLKADATAVSFADQQLSYRELGIASDHLALYLIRSGVQTGDRVVICLDQGLDLIVGILAILKAGGVYVPLDPAYPAARRDYVLRDSGAALVLTSRHLASGLSASGVVQVLLDDNSFIPDGDDERLQLPTIQAEQPAYLIYTSGSSGEPKGVLVNHRNLFSSTLARHSYYPDCPSVFLLSSSVAFDSSVAGIFWTLTGGGELVVSEPRAEQDIGRLAASIDSKRITHTLCLPSLYELLLEYADTGLLRSLQTVIVAGEAVASSLLQLQRTRLPGVALYNEYGPTEATVWCTVYDTGAYEAGSAVPIGRPIANARIFILDSGRRPVPPGIPGEIYVGGAGVACGYWKKPDITAQKFLTVELGGIEERVYRTGDLARYLPDGNIEFIGRVDRQMKLRGYRIEPAEIESALRQHAAINEAVVLLTSARAGTSADPMDADISPEALAVQLLALDSSVAEQMLAEIEALPDEEADRLLAGGKGLSQGSPSKGLHP